MSSNAPNYVLFLSSYAILLYQYRTWLLNGTAVNWITAKHLGLTSNHQGTHNLFLSPSHSMFLEPDINDDKEWRRQTRGNIAGWQWDLSTPSRGRDLRQRTRQWVNVTRPRIQKQSTPLMHPRIAAGRKKRKKKKSPTRLMWKTFSALNARRIQTTTWMNGTMRGGEEGRKNRQCSSLLSR